MLGLSDLGTRCKRLSGQLMVGVDMFYASNFQGLKDGNCRIFLRWAG